MLQTLKNAYAGEASPLQAVADMLTKLEEDTGRQLTRSLHSAAAQLEAARKELAQVRMAKKAHLASWQTFFASCGAGTRGYGHQKTEFQEKETAALTKVSVARKAIKELATKADAPMAGGSDVADVDSESDAVERMDGDEPKHAQAAKKLKTALEAVCSKLIVDDVGTPRGRTSATEHPGKAAAA